MFFELLAIFSLTFLLWYANFRWKRRKMYRMAEKFSSLPSLPFVGNALMFMENKNFLRSVMSDGIKASGGSPSTFWFGPKLFIYICDPVNLETVMNSPHAYGKHEVYQFTTPAVGFTGLFTSPVPQWRKHKRIILPTFNQKILDGFVEIFSKQANVLVNQMQKEAGKGNFDVYRYFSAFTLDAICETTMGVALHHQTKGSEFAEWLEEGMPICFDRMTFSVRYYFDFIFNMTAAGKRVAVLSKKLRTFTKEVIREKKKANEREKKEKSEDELEEVTTKKNTFLQQLLQLSESSDALTETEIMDEVLVMMIGGSDTSAGENSYTFLMLGMHPEIQEKVYKEVIDVIGYDRPVEPKDLPNLQYTEMVIKETLRLFPIAPVVARAVTDDIKLKDGRVIPGGCSVAYGIFQTHRSRKSWPDPLKFDPLRFLPEESAKRHPYSYVPFAAGPRSCVGPKYAMMAMKTAIATVVRRYLIKTNYKKVEDVKVIQTVVLKPVDGFTVSIEERTK